jgi:hypothetical protein
VIACAPTAAQGFDVAARRTTGPSSAMVGAASSLFLVLLLVATVVRGAVPVPARAASRHDVVQQ